MEAVAGFLPKIPWDQRMKERKWMNFHSELMKGDKKALDKVITSLEDLIKEVSGRKEFDYRKAIEEYVQSERIITCNKITEHVVQYLYQKAYDSEIKDSDLRDKFMWNSLNNIVRYLKRVRNDKPAFQLYHPDKEIALGFIERLKNPPVDSNYF